MVREQKSIDDKMVEMCKMELKKEGRRGENGRRLQAIISAKKHGISEVAKIYSISRETLMRWIRKFKEKGSKGFAVAKGRGRRSKLNEEQKKEIGVYVDREGSKLNLKKIVMKIEKLFGLQISKATAHRLVKELGYSYITPRPRHYKKDKTLEEEFKKKSCSENYGESRV